MKTKIVIPTVIILSLTLLTTSLYAQKQPLETPFRKGSVVANLGVGAGRDYKHVNDNSTFGTKAAIEIGIWKAGPGVISLGAEVGGAFSRGGRFNDFRSSTFVVAGRSAWHYGWKVKRLDTYAGLATGVGFTHYDYNNGNSVDKDDVIPVFGAFIGASYFLAPKFAVNIEAGNDVNVIQVGVLFKLR